MKVIDRTKAVTQHFLENSFKKLSIKTNKNRKTQKYMLSKYLLRHDVVRVFVSSLVLVFVRAILSWCPYTWNIYIVCNILCLNISSIYMYLLIDYISILLLRIYNLMCVWVIEINNEWYWSEIYDQCFLTI